MIIWSIARFELTRRKKMLSTYIYAAALFGGAMLLELAAGGAFSGVSANSGQEKVFANSPQSLFVFTSTVALFGLFTVAPVFGHAAAQDFVHDTWMLVFTKNIKRGTYLIGRFLGAWIFSSLLMISIGLGLFVAALICKKLDPTQIGPQRVVAYLWPYLVLVWPTLFTVGAIFFSLAALTRRVAPVYIAVVILVLGYNVLGAAFGDVRARTWVGLVDPFGNYAYDVIARYWTPAEQNQLLAPLSGVMLYNRLIWLAVGALTLVATVLRFRPLVEEARGGRAIAGTPPLERGAVPRLRSTATLGFWWRTLLGWGGRQARQSFRSPLYWSFVLAAAGITAAGLAVTRLLYGTATWPITYQVLEMTFGVFTLFLIIIVTFYAGDLVWRDRDAHQDEIIAASRVPTWVLFGSRFVALYLVAASVELAAALVALTGQLARGFTGVELRLYLAFIGLRLFADIGLCLLALTVQLVIHHKYLAYAGMIVYFITDTVLRLVGLEERLLRFGSANPITYSDMNGFGGAVPETLLWRLHWMLVGTALAVGAYLVFARGTDTGFRRRLREGRRRLGRGLATVWALIAVAAGGSGFFLWHQTHVEHRYITAKDVERGRARYEKTYKRFQTMPELRIVDVDVAADIFPDAQRFVARGDFRVENHGAQPVAEVLVNLPQEAKIAALTLGGAAATSSDRDLGTHVFVLPSPIAPGGASVLHFEMTLQRGGIRHGADEHDVVANGTFINNFELPVLGYRAEAEFVDDRDRKKYGLQPKERMLDRDDKVGLQHNFLRHDADYINFRATVSTSKDQIAVAPGYLEKEWTDGDRRYFRYVMDQPMLNFYSFLSARYAVKTDSWNGVKLEIYYHPTHTYNIDRMMQGMKDTLQYCSEAFGPYQHRQARILEFPRYATFAQSFPNTIPYSEAVGFVARVRDGDPDDIDYPYYITAHEIAHQWWAHQVVAGDTQGATMTAETMAQYSALMVMKKSFGPLKMRRFLKYELDRYLFGRALEQKKEVPLGRVENQPYIHYEKGSIAMYRLQATVGEERLNQALREYVQRVKFKGPPYTNSTELIAAMRSAVPEAERGIIDDLFETITLYDNRVLSATATKNGDGWDVKLKVKAAKFRADADGNQKEIDFSDMIDIGALDERGEAIVIERRLIAKGESEVSFRSPRRPATVGIDPLNTLIDRVSDDNVMPPAFN
jgi:ABC-type transport system involved in multi-copper enzyme maturation permease subunit